MRLSSRRPARQSDFELSMTSMIDVVFLLLIFFVSTSSFLKTERNLDPAIQVKEEGSGRGQRELEPVIVKVVREEGEDRFLLGGRAFTDWEELRDVLAKFEQKQDGAFVQVGNQPSFRAAAEAIQACKSAGFLAVSYVPAPSE